MGNNDSSPVQYSKHPGQSWHTSFTHPQSDDYYDGPDEYSSPTPLPRRSTGAGRHVMEFDMYESFGARVDDTLSLQEVEAYGATNRTTPNQAITTQAPYSLSRTLVPVSTLPDWCRDVFKFGVFNAMQSQCFDTAVNTDSNMVISAPTGAGKTVLFELSVVRLLQSGNNTYKCVYMAPTKAICSERSKDWSIKFAHMGIRCCELTGDTMKSGRSAWKEAKDCAIIITTPEKWDSLTRNWNDSSDFLQRIKLFMVDEGKPQGEAVWR
ncbi:hypothetical protein BN14_01578 [Rhizoctonia solani AG-1 IB]|uniref:Helicase ATP-binding domain-containing protein n=1 Tax=Thanatephorus cucumeris (strain AG1-IB / isolate 7/3/14) TaxID=1108050 RepID=M5BJY5_THACB|nr:hypothetical protein BN14_01578 [Rhizoctonia solani AG-1 IB]